MKYFIIILLVFIVYLPKHGFLDFSLFTAFAVVLFGMGKKLNFIRDELTFLIGFVVYFSVIAIIGIFFVQDLYAPYYLVKFIRLYFIIISIYILIDALSIRDYDFLLDCIFLASVFAVMFEFSFPQYKVYIYSFTGFETSFKFPYRVAGLSMGYDSAGMVISMGGGYYFVKMFRDKFRYKLYFLSCVVASLLTARISFVSLAVVVAVWYLYESVFDVRSIVWFLVYALIGVGVIIYLFNSVPLFADLFEFGISRNFDVEKYSQDSNELMSTFKVNPSLFFSIFGYGFESFTPYGARADVGWFQVYWSAGIFGSFLIVCFYLFMLARSKMLLTGKSKIYFNSLVVMILLIFVGNFKGGYILARQQTEILFVFYCIILVTYIRNKDLVESR